MLAILDVDYREDGARAACVLASDWKDVTPSRECVANIVDVQPYEPGSFYRRELPCLLKVLTSLEQMPEIVVVDGFVWLSAENAPGLGAHLHAAIEGAAAVIGVAKTAFRPMRGCANVAEVRRGSSNRPLFVTSLGLDLAQAALNIAAMHGDSRIPELIRRTDRLARDVA